MEKLFSESMIQDRNINMMPILKHLETKNVKIGLNDLLMMYDLLLREIGNIEECSQPLGSVSWLRGFTECPDISKSIESGDIDISVYDFIIDSINKTALYKFNDLDTIKNKDNVQVIFAVLTTFTNELISYLKTASESNQNDLAYHIVLEDNCNRRMIFSANNAGKAKCLCIESKIFSTEDSDIMWIVEDSFK